MDLLIYLFYHEWEYKQGENRCTNQPTDYHDGQWSLTLASDAMTQGGGQQTQGGHHGCHEHTSDARMHTQFHGFCQGMLMAQKVFDVHDHDDTVLNADTKQADKSDTG